MIKMEFVEDNIAKITIPEILHADDFIQFIPLAEEFIRRHGSIRLLIDATQFNGWQDMKAFEAHMGFVKSHQGKVERIAIIAGHSWQHWLAGVFKIFVHPEISVFDKGEEIDAMRWIAA